MFRPILFFPPHLDLESGLKTAEQMVADGAHILDIGGEATNPFVELKDHSVQEEIDRVIPLVSAIKKRFDVLVSVDTSQARVMREAAGVGADIINDQRSLRDEQALMTVAELGLPVCLMHFFPEQRMPGSCALSDLLLLIKTDLAKAINRCKNAGIFEDRIIIDPGFGQGNYRKNSAENFFLLAQLAQFIELGFPVLSGWSRKSMLGDLLHLSAQDRLYPSIAADTLAVYHGASIIRTHDVKASFQAAAVAMEMLKSRG